VFGRSPAGAITLLALVNVLVGPGLPSSGSAREGHRVSIDVRGPVALVQVDRPLVFGAEYGRAGSDEVVVDLDLPEGAALAGAELRGPGRSMRLISGPSGDAGRRYGDAVRAAGWRAAAVPLDEGVDLRVQVAGPRLGEGSEAAGWSLRYRFAAPLACRSGRLVIAMPGSLDPAPTAAEVDLRLQLGRISFSGPSAATVELDGRLLRPSGGSVARARASVSVGRAWELAIGLPAARGRAEVGTALAAGASTGPGKGLLAVAVCRPRPASTAPAATRLLLLLDRSRSVGPGAAAAARDLARALILALPPTLTFNVLFFDRVAEPLFPLPRSATLEALGALEGAVGLGSLRNGTDLPLALRRAVQLTSDEPADPKAPTYWVVVTDGALPDQATPEALRGALAGLTPERVEVAVIVLRPDGDDPMSPEARRALAEIPARLGGVVRELPTSAVGETAVAIVESLRGAGDLINPVASGGRALTSTSIAPGSGGHLLVETDGSTSGHLVVRGTYAGAPVSLTTSVVAIDPSWARPLLPRTDTPAWLAARSGRAAALIAPAVAGPTTPELPTLRGRMERDVVQRALGYAFLPRARACYLTRAIRTAADFQLKGRLRLELHLERGEMMGAAVRRSTLGRPEIEDCLREAAFAVEVPRALHSDAPVIAALNLVFRPRTEVKKADAGASHPGGPGARGVQGVQDEIDQLLGPRPPPSDPLELLIEESPEDRNGDSSVAPTP
jgi:hypothetical protein